jgi:glycosyltransferase involved in cell wall biosynthesis
MLYSLYQQAEAFVFPAIEDFGIMPVEAMAAGARVVVSARGGAAESVAAIGLGSVSAGDTVEDLVEAISRTTVLDGDRLGISSMFGRGRFVEQIREWIADEH